MKIRTDFPHTVTILENVWIPLADGARLAAKIWLPDSAQQQPVPALLEYIPYRKSDFTSNRDAKRQAYFAGYGYASVPIAVKRRWAALVEGYLTQRRSLAGVVLIMDARRPFTDADAQLVDWCHHAQVATHVLLNKCDKLSRGAGARTLAEARKRLAASGAEGDVQLFSATRKIGIDDLGACLDAWLGYAAGACSES